MGCNNCKGNDEKGVHKHLVSDMWVLNIDSIDDFFQGMSPIIKDLETIREAVIDKRDALYLSTGACCHKTPTLMICLKGFFYKIAAAKKGDILKGLDIEITLDEPYFKLGDSIPSSSKKDIDELIAYVKGFINLPKTLEDMGEKLKEMVEKVEKSVDDFVSQITKAAEGDPFGLPKLLRHFEQNCVRVKDAACLFEPLVKELAGTVSQFKTITTLLKDAEEIAKFGEIGKNADKNKWTKPEEIFYHTCPEEERYGKSPEDGVKFWNGKITNKANAKQASKDEQKDNPPRKSGGTSTAKKETPDKKDKPEKNDDPTKKDDQKDPNDQQNDPNNRGADDAQNPPDPNNDPNTSNNNQPDNSQVPDQC